MRAPRWWWARFIWWLDDTHNHDSASGDAHWQALCDYNDYLITGERT
jgi:hypothetical protein